MINVILGWDPPHAPLPREGPCLTNKNRAATIAICTHLSKAHRPTHAKAKPLPSPPPPPTPNKTAASQNNAPLFICTQCLRFSVGCTVQPSTAQSQPKKDPALSPTGKLKHLWEAQCLSVFQAFLGLPTFLLLCFPLQALPQKPISKSAPSTHRQPRGPRSCPCEVPWHPPGGTCTSLNGPW